jgi:D-alanyl-D-alanine-carboxypeptidase/D-alanyl-D-alanine-endopeptidase
VFFIGSVTKTFTSLLLAEMAARGEVALDDAASKYLPASLPLPTRSGKEITLLQLATNTAGLPVNAGNMTGAGDREQYETHTVGWVRSFSPKMAVGSFRKLAMGSQW